jgi:hypothetical protein
VQLGIPARAVTLCGTALLWGISFDERQRLAEALESDLIPDEWVQASRRRTTEAAAHARLSGDQFRSATRLFATLEYWARKDYNGRLEERFDGSIHLVREEPAFRFGAYAES